ncbi:hypothetical protein BH23GEM7_BH23GEM7_05220 [soil metagenome]
METTWGEDKNLKHPIDLLDEFAGRLAPLGMLGFATIDAHHCAEAADVVIDFHIDRDLAVGLRDLYYDFKDLRGAMQEWFKVHQPSAAPLPLRTQEGGAE